VLLRPNHATRQHRDTATGGEALQAHVTKLLSDHMHDVDKRFSDTMEQLEGLETTFTAKLDAKF
jgi:hypothetical protein